MDKQAIYGVSAGQIAQQQAFTAQTVAQLQRECAGQASKPASVLDLIAGAHDALSGLQQSVAALEQRLGGVLRCSAPDAEANSVGNAVSSDAQAVENLRGLLVRISQTTAQVGSIHDRVQV
jgi:uncharacterized protein YukE